MFKKIALAIGLLFIASVAHADSLGIGDIIKKIPAVNQGVAYSLADSNFNYLATVDLVNWAGFNLEGGYAGRAKNTGDKIVGVLSYDLINLKELGVKIPVLDLIDFRPGLYFGVGSLNMAALGDSETDWGVSASVISLKW